MRPRKALSVFARRHAWAKRALLCLLPNTPRVVQVSGIGPMRVRTRDHRSYWLRDPLEHDRMFLGGIADLSRPGMTVWDVGAHIGLYSRIMSQVLKAERVVAFEPDPRNRALLTENLALGGIGDRAVAFPYALGEEDGSREFLSDGNSTQQGHLVGVRCKESLSGAARLQVEVRRIDTLVASGECPAPDLIKIDVEGAEALVLQGARETLARHSPLIAIELHALEVRLPVFDELDGAGYAVFGYRSRQWRRLTRGDFEKPTTLYDPHHIYAARDAAVLRKPALMIDL